MAFLPTQTISLHAPQTLQATVSLPASKSISARALMVGTLAGRSKLTNLSDCDDTVVLERAFRQRADVIDILAAGTAMRFSTAFFAATQSGTHVITGTERMRQRPIRLLVDALRSLGADISYAGAEGFPPLRITGRKLEGGEARIAGGVSSQYISALLMIAPTLEKGLRLTLEGDVISRPYIDMTLSIMRTFGAKAAWETDAVISIAPGGYVPTDYAVEPDWSAASYWYELVALSPDADACVTLPGLQRDSLQGDSVVAEIFSNLGVRTTFTAEGAVLTKQPLSHAGRTLEVDFTKCPDLAQTVVATCAMLGQSFAFTGLQTLKIKETDRILALQTELARLGITVLADDARMWTPQCGIIADDAATSVPTNAAEATPEIQTYHDHRMAMAFAPCAFRFDALRIAHPDVVTKSYPAFWTHLKNTQWEL